MIAMQRAYGWRSGPHRSARLRFHHLALFLVFTIIFGPAAAVYQNKYKECKQNIQGVLNGTQSIGNITNTTFWDYDYIYSGPAKELDASFPRKEYLTVTYLGQYQRPSDLGPSDLFPHL